MPTPEVTLEKILNFELARAQRESERDELEAPCCPGCRADMMIEEGAWWCPDCEILGEEV